MPLIAVLGTQWGDEGKAKVVDVLAERADVVVRFQGGANAGHTVKHDGRKFVFHLVPSGIMHETTACVIGNGAVVELRQLFAEIDELTAEGIDIADRLKVSLRAHVVMPYHITLDELRENCEGTTLKLGTTKRGIGPAYADKVARVGIRTCDLLDAERFAELLKRNVDEKNAVIRLYGGEAAVFDDLLAEYRAYAERLRPMLDDTGHFIREAHAAGKTVLFEGAQGAMLDLDHGTYPFVTSSNTIAPNCYTGASGFIRGFERVIGIAKAYTTRVGEGPFPTEQNGPVAEHLQKVGGEFGATTGRPRRCGWFDAVAVRYAIALSGISEIFLTKLDVLTGLDEIQVATEYDGVPTDSYPADAAHLTNDRVRYESFPGWSEDITECRHIEELPENARAYVRALEHYLGVRVSVISVGPERRQIIHHAV